MNYETIKELTKGHGKSIKDLLALAPQNDPFYVGSDSELAGARWFANLWQQFGYTTGVHLRRVHYQIVSQNPPVEKPNGTVYENTENDWCYLGNAGKWARYLRLVDPNAFIDRRNPEAIVYAQWLNPGDYEYKDPTPSYAIYDNWDTTSWGYDLPGLPELGTLYRELPEPPEFFVHGYKVQQNYHVELWAEKTTMNDVLIPICQRYRANLVTGAGELSITAVLDFLKRARQAQRPARIFYISDYDPAGLGMPVSVARKIEYFQREEGFDDLDIRLQPLVLTADQITTYNLPRVPVKDSDKRKSNFEAAHGEGQVELDALEALYPGELAEIVTQAILQYYDPELTDRAAQAKDNLETTLDDIQQDVIERHQDDLDAVASDYSKLLANFEQTRAEFNELVKDFAPKIEAHKERLKDILDRAKEVNSLVLADLEAVYVNTDYPDHDLPTPNLPDETDDQLYNSTRDYLDQIEAYKQHKNGHSN